MVISGQKMVKKHNSDAFGRSYSTLHSPLISFNKFRPNFEIIIAKEKNFIRIAAEIIISISSTEPIANTAAQIQVLQVLEMFVFFSLNIKCLCMKALI